MQYVGVEVWCAIHALLGIGMIVNVVGGNLTGYYCWAILWTTWMWSAMMYQV